MSALAVAVPALRGAAAVLALTWLVGGVPRVLGAGLALVAGGWVAAVGAVEVPADVASWPVALRELAVGAALGIAAAVPLLAAATAGRFVDEVDAPAGRTYRTLFGVLAAAVFTGIGGHVTVVTAIASSYARVPILGGVEAGVLAALGGVLEGAVRLALPWLVTAAVVQLALGIGARVGARAMRGVAVTAAVPAALTMMTAALVSTLAVAIAALIRG